MAKSSFLPRYKHVANIIRKRILHGDYALKPIPAERRLAEEIGVNYMTVRRGLQILEKEDILLRQPNGRMRVKSSLQGRKTHLNFAFLVPTLSSGALEIWRTAILKATSKLSCIVRPILYMHWDDPIVVDSLEGFDGIFLHPCPENMPESLAARLRNPDHPVVVVDHDLTHLGIPSIQIFPPVFIQRLLNHLEAMGHTSIGCLNTQPDNSEIRDRINQWRYWMAAHGFSGELVDQSVEAHGDPIQQAYDSMNEILAKSPREETAWFCTTTPAAVGAMRAMLDHGLQPGRDIALCADGGENIAGMLNPRLTALESVDPVPFISYCMDWMMRPGQSWQGPLLMQPLEVPLFIRESTQPNPDSAALREA